MAEKFRWSGDTPQYSNRELCTLQLHHFGLLENGEYTGGKVCYADNVVDDFLSLLDLKKIGIQLGYQVDITKMDTSLKVYFQVPGKNGADSVKEIVDDNGIADLVASIPSSRVVVLYYHDVTDINTIGNQGSIEWASLESATYNVDADRSYVVWPFIDQLSSVNYSVGEEVIYTYENEDVVVADLHNDESYVGRHEQAQNEEVNEEHLAEHQNETEDKDLNKEQVGEDGKEPDPVIVDSDYGVSEDEVAQVDPLPQDYPNNGGGHAADYSIDPEVFPDLEPIKGATGEISSDGEDTEGFDTESEKSDGEVVPVDKMARKRQKKLPRFKQFRKETDLKHPEFRLGMQFANREELKEAIKEYAIVKGMAIKIIKNDNVRVRAICKGSGHCPFLLFASKIDVDEYTFAIKTLQTHHVCMRVDKVKFANPKWLCNRFIDKIRRNPNWETSAFQAEVLADYSVNVSKHQIYRAKRLSKVVIEGSYKQQYARLYDYAEELKKANKGSTVIIKTELVGGQPVFQRMYFCLAACKKGFLEGCRPVIGVDGCHLKGPYTGQILTAVGVDGNNGMFPIAYAIAEIESKSSWMWFLQILKEDLRIENGGAWVFISDKQKGLIPAIQQVFPTTEHRMCVRHLYNNFRAKHSGLALKHILWAAARATTVPWFEVEMEKMKTLDPVAWDWLIKRPAKNWSRYYFAPHYKCDLLLNNLCESFNAAILDPRDKAILTCLERIRVKIMLRMANRRIAGRLWRYTVGLRLLKIIEKNQLGANHCIPRLAGEGKYQVSHMYGGEFAVDLRAKTCSCRRWNVCGILCPHAISCIYHKEDSILNYAHECYSPTIYLKAYDPMVHPIPSMDQWMKTNAPTIQPPPHKQQPGRPKMVRTKEPGEVEVPAPIPPDHLPPNYIPPTAKLRKFFVKIRCTQCGGLGHNRTTCHRQEAAQGDRPNPQRGRGRGRGRARGGDQAAGSSLQPGDRPNPQRGRGRGGGRARGGDQAAGSSSQPVSVGIGGSGIGPSQPVGTSQPPISQPSSSMLAEATK